jgi:hypothetical protein
MRINTTFPELKSAGGFKVFSTMTTNDGNRTQICMGCERVLLKDGKEPA